MMLIDEHIWTVVESGAFDLLPEAILAELGASDPKARQAKPDEFLDMRFIAELEKDGFFKKLALK